MLMKSPTLANFEGMVDGGVFIELSEFLSLLCVCQSDLAEFFLGPTEFAVEFSEFALLKQCAQNSLLPVLYDRIFLITC